MNGALQDHSLAMELAEQAHVARLRGDIEGATTLIRQAFEHERRAAASLEAQIGVEPSRSVLHRSAATLALDCGDHRAAEKLVSAALAGNPPDDIADELRDLLEQVHFHRHLALRGVSLQPDEFQLSLAGGMVGFGIAQSDEFVERVRDLETLLYRTAERKLQKPYRERGRRRDELQRELELYISIPRAASFAVTFRVGSREQMQIPGLDLGQTVVDEVLDCIALLSESSAAPLKSRIEDDAYYRNFIALARRLAPDGDRVHAVGLTAVRSSGIRSVLLSRRRDDLPVEEPAIRAPQQEVGEVVIVRGTLRLGDSRDENRGIIQVIGAPLTRTTIEVPPGLMRDIVRPLFEDEVVVTGRRTGNTITLVSIDRVDDAPLDSTTS